MARVPFGALLLLLYALGSVASVRGSSFAFRVDPERTSARFVVASLGFEAQGQLGRTTGTIVVDAERHVERVEFEIDTRTVDTGWDLRDAFLRSGVMFDTVNHPQVHFRSKRVVYEGARLAAVEGDVTLRGVTRPARFEVDGLECAAPAEGGSETCGAKVVGRISRGAFGMSFAYPLIGDEVELQFVVTASRDRD